MTALNKSVCCKNLSRFLDLILFSQGIPMTVEIIYYEIVAIIGVNVVLFVFKQMQG